MKKLIIAAAIVCAAAFAQAANYKWNNAEGFIYGEAGNYDYPTIAQGTVAYFAFVDAYSQSDLVNDFANGAVNFSKFAAGANNTATADGNFGASAEFSAAYTSDQKVYFALIEAATGNLFISDEVTAGYLATGTSQVGFGDQQYTSDWEAFLGNAKDGYTQAGWYQAAAVPEPTSGLLLLLGVAGLALKRKRA